MPQKGREMIKKDADKSVLAQGKQRKWNKTRKEKNGGEREQMCRRVGRKKMLVQSPPRFKD